MAASTLSDAGASNNFLHDNKDLSESIVSIPSTLLKSSLDAWVYDWAVL